MATRTNGNTAGDITRARLLDAGSACFAERGYRGTTVRDITRRARCNVGAITYHFGSKHGLYVEIFDRRFGAVTARRVGALRELTAGGQVSLEQVLETFAHAFLEPLTDGARGQQTMQLFMRDMVESHLPEGMLIERMFKPTLGALIDALRLACPTLSSGDAQLCCHSLISQLVHVMHMQRFQSLTGSRTLAASGLDATLAHVVAFTAAGIRGRLAEAAA